MTRCVMWKCGGNLFPQPEGLNMSFNDDYHSLSKFVASLGYKSRSILLQNMINSFAYRNKLFVKNQHRLQVCQIQLWRCWNFQLSWYLIDTWTQTVNTIMIVKLEFACRFWVFSICDRETKYSHSLLPNRKHFKFFVDPDRFHQKYSSQSLRDFSYSCG